MKVRLNKTKSYVILEKTIQTSMGGVGKVSKHALTKEAAKELRNKLDEKIKEME